ncbi:hypothetical protein WICPIJ_001004 [Wickerhamomyces pijperi]|uniref:Uncharacterized protein n=1 Tax=Wickerhamomyces pijperi TaxID=599730 RepID=A0A9P8TR52_WICPI|nr:hypothetical protein WICPIJ_001004 [Wickerhamomyces pijperi]
MWQLVADHFVGFDEILVQDPVNNVFSLVNWLALERDLEWDFSMTKMMSLAKYLTYSVTYKVFKDHLVSYVVRSKPLISSSVITMSEFEDWSTLKERILLAETDSCTNSESFGRTLRVCRV